jgi:NAD(P)-dependent dehydrogenase (short-subunit alcohol dehydrogenase family)
VSRAAEVEGMVNKVMGEFGRIDILVNNAGVCTFAPFVHTLLRKNVMVKVTR